MQNEKQTDKKTKTLSHQKHESVLHTTSVHAFKDNW